MYETRNDLPEATRAKTIELLQVRLADAIDVQFQAKQAHWNVKGREFIALHKLFFDVAEVFEKFVDEIAERLVQLGGAAEGAIQGVARRSTMTPYPLLAADGIEHCRALAGALAAFGKEARAAIGRLEEEGDHDSSDLFTSISRKTDKLVWFVEAHVPGAAKAAERAPKKKQVA